MKKFMVVSTYLYKGERSRDMLATSVRLFDTEKDAVDSLNREIRGDWTVEVEWEGKWQSLADVMGAQEDPMSERSSSWGYSDDGRLAWVDNDQHAYRGEIREVSV